MGDRGRLRSELRFEPTERQVDHELGRHDHPTLIQPDRRQCGSLAGNLTVHDLRWTEAPEDFICRGCIYALAR